MAKILFFNVPAYGHVNVTIPVVYELVKRGHQVIYYCDDSFKSTIENTGAAYRTYPNIIPSSQNISEHAHNLANISLMLLKACHSLVPYVVKQIELEKPDLIIYDAINLWARMGAIVTGVPSVVTYSVMILDGVDKLFDTRSMLYAVATSLPKVPQLMWHRNKLARCYGQNAIQFPLFPSVGDLNLVFMSREFQAETDFIDERFRFVGASIEPALRPEQPLSIERNTNPLIYISLGTVNNSNLDFYRSIIATLSDYPAQIILSIGKRVPTEALGRIPEHIFVFDSVPQLEVLRMADVFITHGGMNSIQEAIYYGVPMLVVPQQMEQMINGRHVARLGIGEVINDKPPLGEGHIRTLLPMLDEILNHTDYKTKIVQHCEYSHSAGGYRCAVDEVEAFIAQI